MPKPDFLIVGAMKCGTSTLQAQLATQDGVFMTTPKEPNYFSDDDVYAQGPDWYSQLFAQAAHTDITGEASTHYTKLPTYPETVSRLRAAQPGPLKIIYVIRNPLDRAVSHYIHEWSESRMGSDVAAEFENHPEIVSYGQYALQIAPFIEAFGAASVFLTSLEQIKNDPDTEFSRIAAFLGLPPTAQWEHKQEAQNVSANRARKLPFQALLIDNRVAQFLRQTLVPKSLRMAIRSRLTMQDRPGLPDGLRADLETIFTKDRNALAGFFPDHPALTLCYPFSAS